MKLCCGWFRRLDGVGGTTTAHMAGPACPAALLWSLLEKLMGVDMCVCVCVFHLYVYFIFCLYAQAYLRVVEAGDNWHCCAYEALDCWYAAQTVCIQTPVVDHMHPHASSILLHPTSPNASTVSNSTATYATGPCCCHFCS